MESAAIGPYRILAKIGEGGMGTVYLGEHTLIGRRAAIKVLHPEASAQRDHVDRFFTEARATSAVSDPGIVQIFDFGVTPENVAYIVMELLDGERLDHRLARLRALAPVDAIRIARQLAGSLHAAHCAGIVHRDLKPENIFIVRDPEALGGERPKILDFGIAKLADDGTDRVKTQTGSLLGTPIYMSPEQCRGAGGVIDHRADIYSLGCVLFHLLTGQPPFDPPGMGAILFAHMSEPPPVPSSIVPQLPPGTDEVVLRCLAKAPADRYATMLELQYACDAMLARMSARLPSTIVAQEQPLRASRRRIGVWIGVATVAASGGIALAIATAGKQVASPPAAAHTAPTPAIAAEPPPPPLDAADAPQPVATVTVILDAAPAAPPADAAVAAVPPPPSMLAPPPRRPVRPVKHAPPHKTSPAKPNQPEDLYDDRN